MVQATAIVFFCLSQQTIHAQSQQQKATKTLDT